VIDTARMIKLAGLAKEVEIDPGGVMTDTVRQLAAMVTSMINSGEIDGRPEVSIDQIEKVAILAGRGSGSQWAEGFELGFTRGWHAGRRDNLAGS
jgi:hypothetical protein